MFDLAFAAESHASMIYVLHWIATIIEVVGVGVIIMGVLIATISFARQGSSRGWEESYQRYRTDLGRGILLGIEFLVAADIIGTVAVAPTFQSLGVLGLIIVVRTLLSFALDVEIDGCWPWRRREMERHFVESHTDGKETY
jgi:uncharacterized membrane protein